MKRIQVVNVSLVFTVFMMCIVMAAYAAVPTQPTVINNLDYFSSEPFKGKVVMRDAAILTNSYVETTVIDARSYSKFMLMFDITQGSLTSLEYKYWISSDNVNWYVEASETVAAGTITDNPGNYTVVLPVTDPYFKILSCYGGYVKLEVKGTGTVTASSCTIRCMGVQ